MPPVRLWLVRCAVWLYSTLHARVHAATLHEHAPSGALKLPECMANDAALVPLLQSFPQPSSSIMSVPCLSRILRLDQSVKLVLGESTSVSEMG